jgi:hypothetical protein
MNWKFIVTVIFVMSALALRLPLLELTDWNAANAQESETAHAEDDHDRENTASLAASWKLLQEDRTDIKLAVADGNSSAIHDLGLRLKATMVGMAKHRAEVNESQHERFDSYISQMKILSHDLHHSGEDANLEESQKVTIQVEGMILLVASVVSPSGQAGY